jgi:hypothetical protein
MLDDVMSTSGSSDIADPGTGELGQMGFPRAPLQPTSLRQVAEGGVNVLIGCDRVQIAEEDVGHGRSGSFAIGPGQS